MTIEFQQVEQALSGLPQRTPAALCLIRRILWPRPNRAPDEWCYDLVRLARFSRANIRLIRAQVSSFVLLHTRHGDLTEHAATIVISYRDTNTPFAAVLGVSATPTAL
jgi:hypothetical protein